MKTNNFLVRAFLMVCSIIVIVSFATACSTTGKNWVRHQDKTGAQLWAENCMRFHNFRSPASQSDDAWDVSMHHMRERGFLTAVEHEKILAFLKASN
jgi:hypothetical protein